MEGDSSKYRRPESVLVIVYTRQAEVLLLRRVGENSYWQSITGSLEWGETALSAARRELQEETGLLGSSIIDCRQSSHFRIYAERLCEYAPGVLWNREWIFRCELEAVCAIQLNPHEHIEYQWQSFDEAVKSVRSPSNRDALLAIKAIRPMNKQPDKTE